MFTDYKSFKKVICSLLAAVIMLSLCSCSAKQNENISLYDLNKAMSEHAEFGEMKYVSSADDNSEELFSNISDMDYSKVQGFFINYAVNGTGNADEIACIQVKRLNDIDEAVASLNAHLNKRVKLYSTYDKSQLNKLSKAVVTKSGNVAVLIVCDNSEDIEKQFYAFFE